MVKANPAVRMAHLAKIVKAQAQVVEVARRILEDSVKTKIFNWRAVPTTLLQVLTKTIKDAEACVMAGPGPSVGALADQPEPAQEGNEDAQEQRKVGQPRGGARPADGEDRDGGPRSPGSNDRQGDDH